MIRVGIIGAGFMGRNHFNQYEKLSGRSKVVALCDKEADRRIGDWSKVGGNVGDKQGTKRDLGDIKPYRDWRELVTDPDVDMVDICAPTFLHREMSIEALGAGKHVLCEKPMSLSVEDCDAMIEAAAESPGKFMIAQVVRFWPEYVYLKQVIDAKELGSLRVLHLRRQAGMPDYSLDNWIWDPQLSGGAILDLRVHDVDFAVYLFGKPKSVYAQGYQNSHGSIDRVHASWDYGAGLVVQLEGYWDMPTSFGFNMGFTAVFEDGAILWDLNSGKPLTVFRPDSEPETPEMRGDDGYFREVDYFLNCIEKDKDPQTTTPHQSRDAVALALAEGESVRIGEPVKIK
ncbi:MAG: Gfo/Idh/MocA family oxidoreductase [Planctomycetota bacterium]|nr:MAG: Gfo/Idh/MocA family oxidoreductase [Planctomycetota bacterium]